MDHLKHLKRSSLHSESSKHHQKGDKKGSLSPSAKLPKPTNSLDLVFESPPNIFYGNTTQSTGALFSGQLCMTVVSSPELILDTFAMQLVASIVAKKPVSKDCPDCITKTTELHHWTFITEPKHLTPGTHSFPFSYLLPGHLPATTSGHLGVLEYYLVAKATTRTTGEPITLRRALPIYRAIHPLPEKNSLRIFPPMNFAATVTLIPVIHPIGDFPVLLRLSGVTHKTDDKQTRWRLRKLDWKLEETEKMVSPACSRHAHKVGGEGKGVQHETVRTLAEEELKEGWKSDFDEGNIELEFTARASGTPNRPLCDVESPTGLSITHALVVEMIVAEEWVPIKKPNQISLTGAARVLRMQFQLVVTERSGMGISWDEEQPPMYEDVPASPPLYAAGSQGARNRGSVSDYEGPPLEDVVERLNLGDRGEGSSSGARR